MRGILNKYDIKIVGCDALTISQYDLQVISIPISKKVTETIERVCFTNGTLTIHQIRSIEGRQLDLHFDLEFSTKD